MVRASPVSLWRRGNARNVRLYCPYRQYTNLFIFRFVSLLCLRSTLRSSHWSSGSYRLYNTWNHPSLSESPSSYKFNVMYRASHWAPVRKLKVVHTFNVCHAVHHMSHGLIIVARNSSRAISLPLRRTYNPQQRTEQKITSNIFSFTSNFKKKTIQQLKWNIY